MIEASARMRLGATGQLGVIVALATLAMLPNFIWGPGASDSTFYSYLWTHELGEAMRSEVFPRWLPGTFDGYGSPTFFFYPPLFYELAGALYRFGVPVDQSINLVSWATLAAAGVAMRAWLRANNASWAWAILYMLAPYHLYDLYARGALAEFAAFVWIPLIALGVQWLPRRRGVLLTALAYAGIIVSHLPTALIVSVALIAPLCALRHWKTPRTLAVAAAALCLGLMLAGFYLATALTLLPHIVGSAVLSAPYYSPPYWSLWAMIGRGEPDQYFPARPLLAFGWSMLALGAMGGGRRFWPLLSVICALASVCLLPIWSIPPMGRVQFPWRILSLLEFTAIAALALGPPPRRALLAVGVAAMLPFCAVALMNATAGLSISHRDYVSRLDRFHTDAAEYAPAGIGLRKQSEAGFVALAPTSQVGHGAEVVRLAAPGKGVFRRFYFPIWQVVDAQGKVFVTAPDGPYRLVSFSGPQGEYRLKRVALPVEIAGWWLSALAAAVLMLIAASGLRRRRVSARA